VAAILGNEIVAAYLINNLFLLLALMLLYRLAEYEFKDSEVASRVISRVICFPVAFFFSIIYTESLFLFATVGCIYYTRLHRWKYAVVFGFIASMTRIPGVLVVGFAGLEWLAMHGWTISTMYRIDSWQHMVKAVRTDYRTLFLILLMSGGLLVYMFYLWIQFGDPIAFSSSQVLWHRDMTGPFSVTSQAFETLKENIGQVFQRQLESVDDVFVILFDYSIFLNVMVTSVIMWKKLGEHYAIYSASMMLIPFWSHYISLSRFGLVIFPMFMMLGLWMTRKWVFRILLAGFVLLQFVLFGLFIIETWVA
jgi:hypothetical protein